MEQEAHTIHRWFAVTLSILLILGDWIAKLAALHTLTEQKIPIFNNVLDLALHKNYGVVSNAPVPLSIVLPLTVVIIALCVRWLTSIWNRPTEHRLSLALILLIAGATGNFVDRVVHGFTTDYLLLVNRSVINIADILIVLGVLGILFYTNNTPSSAT